MKVYNTQNINTSEYWDQVYQGEVGTNKVRVDQDRISYLVKEMDIEEGKLLDVGCGNGEMLRWIHNDRPHYSIHGIDITPTTLQQIKKGWPDWDIKEASIYSIPFPENYFDVIFCGETIEHLENTEAALDELFRVCKEGGKVVISLPNEDRNTSVEHLKEFTIFDVIKMNSKYGEVTDIKVLCSGLSIISTTIKKITEC